MPRRLGTARNIKVLEAERVGHYILPEPVFAEIIGKV
jgi:hypothetical protein